MSFGVSAWLVHLGAMATVMATLCGGGDTYAVRVYSPVLTVSALVEDAKGDEIYLRLVGIVRRTSSIDREDPGTSDLIRRLGYDEALKHNAPLRYVDSAGIRTDVVLARTSEFFTIPTRMIIVIGYGRDPIPDDQLVDKASELADRLKSICEQVGSPCDVVVKRVPFRS